MYIRKSTIVLVAAFSLYGLFELGCTGWLAFKAWRDQKEHDKIPQAEEEVK